MADSSTSESRKSVVAERAVQVQAARAAFKDMPREAVRGYPVPVMQANQIYLAFPFFMSVRSGAAGRELTAPGWIAYIDVSTGQNVSLERQDVDFTRTLGTHTIEPPLDMKQFRRAEARLFEAMSALLPIVRRPQSGVPADLTAEAEQFRALWSQLAHKPLASHYKALNPAWFETLAGN